MNDKKKDLTKEELAKDFAKVLGDLENTQEVEKMISDNVIEFEIKNIKYHVRQLTFEENTELERYRRTKYMQFMDDPTMLFQEEWIEKYKKKGINLDKMEETIRGNIQKENQIMITLAQTADKDRVDELKSQIIEIRKESAMLNIKRVDLLSYSIQDQLMVSINSFFTFLALEKQVDDKSEDVKEGDKYPKKWERVYKNFQDFSKSKDSVLLTKAFQYVSAIIYKQGI